MLLRIGYFALAATAVGARAFSPLIWISFMGVAGISGSQIGRIQRYDGALRQPPPARVLPMRSLILLLNVSLLLALCALRN